MQTSKRADGRRPTSYYQVAGLDLQCEMRWLCTLPVFGGGRGSLARSLPTLNVRRASARPRRNLGFAVPAERRISVTAYPGIRPGDVQETLLHELVHIAVGRHGRSWHGQLFRRTLREAMRQAYGITTGPARGSTHGAYAEALERRSRRALPRSARGGLHPQQLALDTAA
jgi:WLM domain